MPKALSDVSASYKLVTSADGAIGIQFIGRIDHVRAAALIKRLKDEIADHAPIKVTADLNRITYFDDFGVLVLSELRNFLNECKIPFNLIQPPPKPGEVLALFNFNEPGTCPFPEPKKRDNLAGSGGNMQVMTADLKASAMQVKRAMETATALRQNTDRQVDAIQRQVLVTLNRIHRATDSLNRFLGKLSNQPSQVIFSAPAIDKP